MGRSSLFAATVGRRAVWQNWLIGGGADDDSQSGICVILAQILSGWFTKWV
jgi:hypothetical protein